MKRALFLIFVLLLACGCQGKVEKVSPQNKEAARIHYERGLGFVDQKKLDEAFNEFKEALKLNPNYAQAYCETGIVYMEKGNFEKAIEPLKKSLQINPKYPKSNYALAVAAVRKTPADLKAARYYYKRAVSLGYNVPDWFPKYLEKLEKSVGR